jgi:hypothetical protein
MFRHCPEASSNKLNTNETNETNQEPIQALLAWVTDTAKIGS